MARNLVLGINISGAFMFSKPDENAFNGSAFGLSLNMIVSVVVKVIFHPPNFPTSGIQIRTFKLIYISYKDDSINQKIKLCT